VVRAFAGAGLGNAVNLVTSAYIKSETPNPKLDKTVIKKLNHLVRLYQSLPRNRMQFEALANLNSAVFGMIDVENQFLVVRDLFEQAISLKGCSAWVAANDITGFLALRYLSQKGVDIPDDIAMLGFDDTKNARVAGLSSYNFRIPDISRLMISYILKPLHDEFKNRMCIEFPGIFIERASSMTGPRK
jgi:DNA-binding LacI/PurR family transcriptional regulator